MPKTDASWLSGWPWPTMNRRRRAAPRTLMRIPDLRLFDVALIDWESRSEPAVHLLDVLRRLAPGLPVIACTTTPERAAGALAAGAVDVLIKPVDIDAARTVLSRHARGPAGGGFGLARSSNGATEPTATAADDVRFPEPFPRRLDGRGRPGRTHGRECAHPRRKRNREISTRAPAARPQPAPGARLPHGELPLLAAPVAGE
jgi:CheY-like chemotaxis protein